jgi:site-specific DNA-methyltransferase (cytosine-N4-specific)
MFNPYYTDTDITLYHGDTLEVLKELPSESVDTIVTSPPYWGLRDYGESTYKIWGGNKNCDHQWIIKKYTVNSGMIGLNERLQKQKDNKNSKFVDSFERPKETNTSFCSKCGAWYGQLGLEPTLEMYIEHLLQITAELKRVLKKTGVMFWNHGDCYGGNREKSTPTKTGQVGNQQKDLTPKFNKNITLKCLALQNYRLILRMIDEQQWILRNIIIWAKPNAMPSSVKDRFTTTYEPVFMLVKNKKYWFDLDAVRKPYTKPMNRWGGEKLKARGKSEWDKNTGQETYRDRDMRPNKLGKNPGDVWTIPTQPFPGAHFATFPPRLVEPMIKAGCPQCGIVLDPFSGSGTTGVVARKLGRNFIGIDLNREYLDMSIKRLEKERRLL